METLGVRVRFSFPAHIDGGLTAREMTGTLPWSGRMGLLALMLLGLMWMRRGGMPRARHRA